MRITRRSVLGMAAGIGLLRGQARPPLTFGFSLYGMRSVSWREGLSHVARIGYKATELCLLAGWDTEPGLLNKQARTEMRQRMGDLGLVLPSVMEKLNLSHPGGVEANLERLRNAAEIGYDASPGPPALIETTAGGRVGIWDDLKNAMVDELGSWSKKVEELKVALALKAHSMNAMNLPEREVWLVNQVRSPRIKLLHDYSHFAPVDLDMRETMEQVFAVHGLRPYKRYDRKGAEPAVRPSRGWARGSQGI